MESSLLGDLAQALSNINVIFYIIAYVSGGIPVGVLITRIFAKKNLLEVGSKSTGATNVYRAFVDIDPKKAKFFSLCTLFLDAIKGLVVVLIAKIVGLDFETQYAIAIICVLGHCYSPFLGFQGGKGVSTAIGSILLLVPIEGILGLVVWGIVGKVFKVSSLSSLLGVLSGVMLSFIVPALVPLPAAIDINQQLGTHTPLVVLAALIFYTHLENIYRLITRQERKVL